MADDVHPSQPIPPGTRVAVFGAYEPSATGVGYFGTLVRVVESSMCRWPCNPERWQYMADFPRFGERCLVQAVDLLVVAEADGETKLDCAADSVPADWLWEIRFDGSIQEDNTDVRGDLQHRQPRAR